MKVRVYLKNGHVTAFPNVRWHPKHREKAVLAVPAGAWVREQDVSDMNDSYNEACRKMFPDEHADRSLSELYDQIEFAEMPLEILADYGEEPWRNTGNVVKSVPYGGDDAFWEKK